MNEYCENCEHLKCMGYHYYECTNENSEHNGQAMSRGDSCNQYEEE